MGQRVSSKIMIEVERKKLLKLIIASKNSGKVKEFQSLLKDFSLDIKSQPEQLKVEETGANFIENARIKAIAAAAYTGELSLADDSGLCVEALSGAPGIYSARYADSDRERIKRLLSELSKYEDRHATFIAALCIASPSKGVLIEIQGKCEGIITTVPRGKNGFGYDPIFEELETKMTFAEMNKDQKIKFGHRGKAFQELRPLLKKFILSSS